MHLTAPTEPHRRFKLNFAIYSPNKLSCQNQKNSHLTQQNERRGILVFSLCGTCGNIYCCTSGKCQQPDRRKSNCCKFSKLFMQNSSCSINCIQTSMSKVDQWGIKWVCGPVALETVELFKCLFLQDKCIRIRFLMRYSGAFYSVILKA